MLLSLAARCKNSTVPARAITCSEVCLRRVWGSTILVVDNLNLEPARRYTLATAPFGYRENQLYDPKVGSSA